MLTVHDGRENRHCDLKNKKNNNNRDVTVTDTMAQSYMPLLSQTPGAAAEAAANRNWKTAKYAPHSHMHSYTNRGRIHGNQSSDGIEFLGDLGRRITRITDDKRESAFLFQRMSVVIQQYNAVAIQGTFAHITPEDEFCRSSNSFAFYVRQLC